MIYSGVPNNQWAALGVAILIRNDWKTGYKTTCGFWTELF
jgi:hypothetical protein